MEDGNKLIDAELKLILTFGVKQLVCPLVICLGHEHFRLTTQVVVFRRGRINKLLRRRNAVLFQHHDEHLGVDDRPSIKKFHLQN